MRHGRRLCPIRTARHTRRRWDMLWRGGALSSAESDCTGALSSAEPESGAELVQSALQPGAQARGRVLVNDALAGGLGGGSCCGDDERRGVVLGGAAGGKGGTGSLERAAERAEQQTVASGALDALASAFGCRNVICHTESIVRR